MTSNLIDTITRKSKNMLFEFSKAYRSQGKSCVPYEELIATHPDHPDFVFLIHKNMIFDRGSICDSSYNVFSFDKEGNFVKKEDEQPVSFFRKLQIIKKI